MRVAGELAVGVKTSVNEFHVVVWALGSRRPSDEDISFRCSAGNNRSGMSVYSVLPSNEFISVCSNRHNLAGKI